LTPRLAALFALVGTLLTVPAAPAAAQETVTVSLTDFQVTAVPTSVVEGTVVFQVRNDGAVAHNFVVIKTNLAPDALPVDDDAYLVDEGQLDVVARSVELLGGEATEVRVDLAPASYVLICNNIATHYQAGMYVGFQVTAAPEPTATPPTSDGASAATATPAATDVSGVPGTGQGPQAASSGWWVLAALAALGVALAGLGAATYRRAGQRR
jgi:uncharacterized cupredoxin-like copper-binding protein